MKISSSILVLALLCISSGCRSIDYNYPKEETRVIQSSDNNYLAQSLSGISAPHPSGFSGFHTLENGLDALTARLVLAERAEASIDIQYYLIKHDMIGREFLRAIMQAADRGVRVRLLLDDILTSGFDSGLLAIDSHPKIQIRIFNPFNRGIAGRIVSSITNFSRINRRMHNKSFTVDNEITIIGGRNIADEYFGGREDVNFQDLDVVGVGPIVDDASFMFDTYWNHETAIPVAAFIKELEDPKAERKKVQTELEDSYRQILASNYSEAVRNKFLNFLDEDKSLFYWAPYEFVYDSPDKGISFRAKSTHTIRAPLLGTLESAQTEIHIISPYFVPRPSGITTLADLQKSGVQVTVLTNSMAANNHLAVHSGYAPSRKPMLQHGVKIYEVRPDARVSGAEIVSASGAKATLHTKAFIVDRKDLFIGSFNFDPRSININTEMGVIIKLPFLADYFVNEMESAYRTETYEVFLNEAGELRWRGFENGREVIYKTEPDTEWFQRFKNSFIGLFPIKGQL